MGESKPAPLDVSLNELMPALMSDSGIIIPTRAEVNNFFHPGSFRRIKEIFALPQLLNSPDN
jgi:hypothetical protein